MTTDVFSITVTVMQIIILMIVYYQTVVSIFGLLPSLKSRKQLHNPQKKFAVVIAAHNEEKVIEGIINSLQQQNYPDNLYSIMVICDNCTDSTADIVKQKGALAFERFNNVERGKGFALEWMFQQIFQMEEQYDAIIVLDADNVVSRNFLIHMNDSLCSGHKIIQGYLDTKNPDDSWITSSYAIMYWCMARLWQLSRFRVGLPNALGGTGMCFDIAVLKELGWGVNSLVEDLEFTAKSVLHGIRPVWNHQAKVFDEKPINFGASWHQRKRWMRGHWDVAFRYVGPLLKRFFTKFDLRVLDTLLYLFQPAYFLLGALLLIITPFIGFHMEIGFHLPQYIVFLQWLFPPLVVMAMVLEKVKLHRFIGLLWFQLFGLSWLPLTIIGLFTHRVRVWNHTMHTRDIRIDQIEGSQFN